MNPADVGRKGIEAVKEELGENADADFSFVGDFTSIRRKIPFNGYMIEADECIYPSGSKLFELEIESEEPEAAKESISKFLHENNIKFTESETSKYGFLRKQAQRVSENLKNKHF